MSVTTALESALHDAGLRYTSDREPGIRRIRGSDGFEYRHPNGRSVADEETLGRIQSLAIPPAYEEVWICPDERGHLQATGKDARGRKQYRYHPAFRAQRDADKFARLADFGRRLPRIRKQLEQDQTRRGLPREKVLATVVHLLERSLIRVGNEQYAQENQSFGLTTLRNRHVRVTGTDVRFRFVGKSGVAHRITLKDRRIARIVGRLQELPGQELFQYLDDDGNPHRIHSEDVNQYLREISGAEVTAKDFRTWAGSLRALQSLAPVARPATQKETKAQINAAIKGVAEALGNTPAVCRKCYVHPAVLEAFAQGQLRKRAMSERALIALLKEQAAEKSEAASTS